MGGIIYMYTCRVNGKKYIGQTWHLTKRKWFHKKANVDNRLFHAAIKKHGYEAFDFEVLHDEVSDQDHLDLLEWLEIFQRKTIAPNGYNIAEGGSGGHAFGEESKKRASESAIRRWSSAEERLRMSEKTIKFMSDPENKKLVAERNREKWRSDPNFRKSVLKELQRRKNDPAWREKVSKACKSRSRPVVCVDSGVLYSGLTDAHEKTGLSISGICNALNGRTKTTGGFRWRYASEEEAKDVRK